MDNKRASSFPKNTVAFLKKLSKNNNREWFSANRNLYDKDFLDHAIQFVVEMGEKLQKISPHIHAIPKIDKSIFRIYRDVRFSKNREPYKTNMGLYFYLLWWQWSLHAQFVVWVDHASCSSFPLMSLN